MRVEIRLIDIMRVVRRDDLNIILFRKPQQDLVDLLLLRHPVALQFDVVIILEDVQPPLELILSLGLPAFQDGLRDQRTQAAGRRDQSLVIFMDEFLIDPWILAVHPLNEPE